MELPRPIELYIQDLQRNRLGAAVFGSWARGDNRPNSDIDLLVLTDGLERRSVEKIGDVNVEIVYTSEEGARKFALKRMDSFLNMWRDAQIVFDTSGGLQRLKEFAAQTEAAGKPAMETWQLEHKQFDTVDSLRAVESLAKQDSATAEMYLQRIVYDLLQFYFDKNRLWAPAPKKQLLWLREHDKPIADKFDTFYNTSSIEEKLKVAQELAEII